MTLHSERCVGVRTPHFVDLDVIQAIPTRLYTLPYSTDVYGSTNFKIEAPPACSLRLPHTWLVSIFHPFNSLNLHGTLSMLTTFALFPQFASTVFVSGMMQKEQSSKKSSKAPAWL